MFTKEEIEDIEVVYRSFCGDGRILTDLELNIMKKLRMLVEQLPAPMEKVTLEEFKKNYDNVLCET